MFIHAPKRGFCWMIWPPKWETYQRKPEKALPCVERRHMTYAYRSLKLVHRWDLWAWRRDEKRKHTKETLHWKRGIRRDHSRRRIEIKLMLHGRWSPGSNSSLRFSLKSVKRFPRCGGVEIRYAYIPFRWPLAYSTACAAKYKPL